MKKIFLSLIKFGFIAFLVLALIGLLTQVLLLPFQLSNVFLGAFLSSDNGMAGLHPAASSIIVLLLSIVYIVLFILAVKFGPAVFAKVAGVLGQYGGKMMSRQGAQRMAGQMAANKIANSKLGRRAGLNGFGARSGLEGLFGNAAAGLGAKGKKGKTGDGDTKPLDGKDKDDKSADIRKDPNVKKAMDTPLGGVLDNAIDDVDRKGDKKKSGSPFDPSDIVGSPVAGATAASAEQTAALWGAPFNGENTGPVTNPALDAQMKDEQRDIEARAFNTPGLGRSDASEANPIGQRAAAAADTVRPPEVPGGDPATAVISTGVASAALGGLAGQLTSQQLLETDSTLGTNYVQNGQLGPELANIGGTSAADVPIITQPVQASQAAQSPVMQPSAVMPSQSATQIITAAVGGNGDISGAFYTPDATLTQMAQGASEAPRTAAPSGSYLNQMVQSMGDNPAGSAALGAALGAAIIGSMHGNQAIAGGDAMIQAQAKAMSDAMAREYQNRPGFDQNDRSTWSPELGAKMDALSTAMTGALTAQTAALNQQLKQHGKDVRTAVDSNGRRMTDAMTSQPQKAGLAGSDVIGGDAGIRDVVKNAISRIAEAAMHEADERAGNNRFVEDPANRRSVRDAIQGE